MTTRDRICRHCGKAFKSLVVGRPRGFCYQDACRRAMRLAWGRDYRVRIKNGHVPKDRVKWEALSVPDPPPPAPKPVTWWVAQAMGIVETCEKCEGPVEGAYVPPTPATMGECAVVAHCRICGRERMVIAGRMGVPYGVDNG